MDMSRVQFLWCADEINARADEYWRLVMDIARTNTISRIKRLLGCVRCAAFRDACVWFRRCGQIMGRESGDGQPASQIFYPAMQAADIFFLKV